MGNRQALTAGGSWQFLGERWYHWLVCDEWEHPGLCCCLKLLAGIAVGINLAFLQIPFNKSLKRESWAGCSSLWVQVNLSGRYVQVTALRADPRMDTCTHVYLSYLGCGKRDYLDFLFRTFFFWKALCLELPERMRQTGCLHGPVSKKKAVLRLPGDIQEGKCN